MQAALLVLSHLGLLGLAVYSTITSGVRVQVLFYAYAIDYVLRLATIKALHDEMTRPERGWLEAVAPLISRAPARGQRSHPVLEGEGGPPARLGAYIVVMLVLGFFAFVLASVGPERTLDVTPADANADLSWAVVIGVVYWVNGLVLRVIVIDPGESFRHNLGYNTRELTILALAVVTGSVAVAVRQEMELGASGWTVMGPLLGFRFVFDLSAALSGIGRARVRVGSRAD